jgi:WD40 repeat protein
LAFIDNGRRLVSVSHRGDSGIPQDSTVRLWEIGLQGGESVLRGHKSYVYPVLYSPDGRWIASGAWDHTIRLWDAATGEACATLQQPGVVWGLAFNAEGNWLVGGGDYGGELLLWDVATGQLRSRMRAPGNRVRGVAVHPDGTRVAVGYIDANAKQSMSVLDMATGREMGSGAGFPFVFSPDGKWIVGRGRDGSEKNVVLWDAQTVQPVVSLQGHAATIHAIAFSRDGRRLVSASSDRTVRLWEVDTGQCLRVFEANTDIVFSAVFHPDGKRMASAGRDGTIWLWDLATGQKVARLDGHTSYVYSLAFSPDGRSLVSGSGDSTVRVWDTVPLAERYEARRQAESLRPDAERLVERMTAETKNPAEIVAALRSDRELGEPLRQAALRAVVGRYSK